MKQRFLDHAKNLGGWTTKRKLVLFSVDDYGSVRVHSKDALAKLGHHGVLPKRRFDAYDTLETREDLIALFKVLQKHTDNNNRNAVFTPYALPCNIDFETILDDNLKTYRSELTNQTFEKLASKDDAYADAWNCWKEGIEKGVLAPEFHGREHLNVSIFNELLQGNDVFLHEALKNRSYLTLPSHNKFPHGWTAAFAYRTLAEVESFSEIIMEGIQSFESVYGYKPNVFTPPAQQFPVDLDAAIPGWDLAAMDRPFSQKRTVGSAKKTFISRQKQLSNGVIQIVRNVVFEPTENPKFNAVDFALKQVEAAFRMNKPANISSHRVNFAGHISAKNREAGLAALDSLLTKITDRWPDVEFISVGQLATIIAKN